VLTRSGDTPPGERRQMLRHPPEILITTPESLALLTSSKSGQGLLTGVQTVILDEVHAILGNKRGTHLMCAVERLTQLSGEVQRLALSATVSPATRIAQAVGGFISTATGVRQRRQVHVVAPIIPKRYELQVRFPRLADAGIWPGLTEALRNRVRGNRSTLVFVNSRRMAEKVTRLVNEAEPTPLAYAHHGSLSREVRLRVEEKLKSGALTAIVATSSLELGIDIGTLDEVLLVGTPRSVASALQRLGRAGHTVTGTSTGQLYTTHLRDLRDAAALVPALAERDLEPLVPPERPLDILAQWVLALTAHVPWHVSDLHAFFQRIDAYAELTLGELELVLEMLSGRYAHLPLVGLRARLLWDRVTGVVQAVAGVASLVYRGGGTIVDRGQYPLRLSNSGGRLGELDEEFVWERKVGDAFTLGTQTWRIDEITAHDVWVTAIAGSGAMAPFWRAEALDRDLGLSERVAALQQVAEQALAQSPGGESFRARLISQHAFDAASADSLVSYFVAQRRQTRVPLPHAQHLVVERSLDVRDSREHERLILHTLWGGRINRTLALALAELFTRELGTPPPIVHDDDCVMVGLPHATDVVALLRQLADVPLAPFLKAQVESSGTFGAQFREAAARALILPKRAGRLREPLWRSRQLAKRLLASVSGSGDFPLVVEALRTTYQEALDLPGLTAKLAAVVQGTIAVSECRTTVPSPQASSAVWQEINQLIYANDASPEQAGSRLNAELFQSLVLGTGQQHPKLDATLVTPWLQRRQGIGHGETPESAMELLALIKERLCLDANEWQGLMAACDDAMPGALVTWCTELGLRLLRVEVGTGGSWVVALERLPLLSAALARPLAAWAPQVVTGGASVAGELERYYPTWTTPADLDADEALANVIAEWLATRGPLPVADVPCRLGVPEARLFEVLSSLVEDGALVQGVLLADDDQPQVCDAELWQALCRRRRYEARFHGAARKSHELAPFLALAQRLLEPATDSAALPDVVDRLVGYAAPCAAWETELLPVRMTNYQPRWLDEWLAASPLLWLGAGPERCLFALADDLELLAGEVPPAIPAWLSEMPAQFSLLELASRLGLSTASASAHVWEQAWAGVLHHPSYSVIRRGVQQGFVPEVPAPPSVSGPRPRLSRWQAGRPLEGAWQKVPWPVVASDPLDQETLARERARLLLGRYGFVCRELVAREGGVLAWAQVARAFRLMELSGEVVSGCFFEGLSRQFATPAWVTRCEQQPRDWAPTYCVPTLDPAALMGVALPGLPTELPRRAVGNWLAYGGAELVLVIEQHAQRLRFLATPDDTRLAAAVAALTLMLTRHVEPRRSLRIESINEEPAHKSPYRRWLEQHFVVGGGPRHLYLESPR